MTARPALLAGGLAGSLWAAAVVWAGVRLIDVPIFALLPTLASAFIGPGLVLALLILVASLRRRLDDTAGNSTGAETDARVLRDTLEQVALALCLWPATAYLATGAGPGLVAALGAAFVPARLAFWAGARVSAPLRAFGFAATFCTTLLAFGFAVVSAFDFATGLAAG